MIDFRSGGPIRWPQRCSPTHCLPLKPAVHLDHSVDARRRTGRARTARAGWGIGPIVLMIGPPGASKTMLVRPDRLDRAGAVEPACGTSS